MRRLSLIPTSFAVGAALALAACSTSSSGPIIPVRTHPMGERVMVGHLIYTVFETEWMMQLGEGPGARIPQSRFFLVRMSAANSGGTEVTIPDFTLEDDSGNTYAEEKNGDQVPQWMGYLIPVKPAEAAQGNVVFDVPPRHYKIRVTDENGERAALIDIPLSFGAETPDVVIPGEKKN